MTIETGPRPPSTRAGSGRRPRRWRRWAIGAAAGLLVLALVAVLAIGWYFSDRVLTVRTTARPS